MMKNLTKDEARDVIYKIFNYIDGTDEYDEKYDCYLGHPAIYFIHSKDEFESKLEEFLSTKKTFDKFDIYYFSNKMIKFLIGSYDSHTKVGMIKSDWLPIKFKFINDKIYVIKVTDTLKKAQFGELVSINGINIETIISEIEAMTCYSTKEYLEVAIQTGLNTPNVLKSLPSFGKSSANITYTVSHNGKTEDYTFNLEHLKDYPMYELTPKRNYSYKIQDGVLILVYNSCKDIDAMKSFIDEISDVTDKENITKFILDLRGNRGGDSRVIKPLIEFLKGKDIVTLVDEYVFSSGRFACIDLRNIGSYFIGTNISTTLNAFGNISNQLYLDDLGLGVNRSTKYFYFGDDLPKVSINKTNFTEIFKTKEEFTSLDPLVFEPDELVYRPLEDYMNGTDAQMGAAIKYLKSLDYKHEISEKIRK